MRLLFGLVILLLVAPLVWAQDEVCEGLRGLHAEYGDAVLEYLSETGKSCIEPAETVDMDSTTETILFESGRGDWADPVDLKFSPGIYRFELINFVRGVDGYISFQDVISLPDECFPIRIDTMQFPRQLRIEHDCRVLATLDVSAFYASGDKEWQAQVSKFDPKSNNAIPANEWLETGRGDWSNSVDLRFSPGIWRFDVPDFARGDDGYISFQDIIEVPDGCFPIRIDTMQFPTQLRVEQHCRILTTFDASIFSAGENKDWVATIAKLA